MKCEKVNKKLNDYITGTLGEKEKDRIERHLSDCPICTEELALTREFESLLNAMEPAEPPAELWDNIKKEIGKTETTPAKISLRDYFLFPANPARRFATAFAFIIIITGAGIFFWQSNVPVRESVYPSDYVADHILTSYDDPLSDRIALNLIIAGGENSE